MKKQTVKKALLLEALAMTKAITLSAFQQRMFLRHYVRYCLSQGAQPLSLKGFEIRFPILIGCRELANPTDDFNRRISLAHMLLEASPFYKAFFNMSIWRMGFRALLLSPLLLMQILLSKIGALWK